MSIDTLLPLIQTALQNDPAIKAVVRDSSVYIHAGKFTWPELKKRSFTAPALFISCLGWQEPTANEQAALDQGNDHIVVARLAIGVVAKHSTKTEQRNTAARLLAQQATSLVLNQDWDQEWIGEANRLRCEGLFVPAAEAENCSMWLLTWYQPLALSPDVAAADIDDWLRAHGDIFANEDPALISVSADIQLDQ